MGKYTIYENEDVDKLIQIKLDLIVDNIIKFIGSQNIKAIILTGGFGRGEGGVIIDNGSIKLINDMDINIICKPQKYRNTIADKKEGLEQLAQKLADDVDIKQIDLGISHPARFYFSTNRVGIYEYRNGYKSLFGNIDVKRRIKNYKAENLPLADGTQYFLTRGSGLLIAALYFYNKKNIYKKDRENFLIETNKSILAMGDSFLLLNKKYHYSYQERLNRLTTIDFKQAPNGKIIKEIYYKALQWKLRPNLNWQGDIREIKRWFYIRDLLSEYFIWFEQKRLNQKIKNWQEYIKIIYTKQNEFGVHLIKKIIKLILSKNSRKDFSAKLSVMPGLLFAPREDNGINKELFEEAIKNLNKYYNIQINNFDWENMVIKYLNIFHPNGIVKRITAEQS